MLDIKLIRENPEKVQKAAKDKGVDIDVDKLLVLDKKAQELHKSVQKIQEERNALTKDIKGKPAPEQIEKGKAIKQQLDEAANEYSKIDNELKKLLMQIPNPAKPDVKIGKDESENDVIKTWGEPTKFSFKPKDHLELGEALGIIDMERAAKVSGARFAYLKGKAVLLEFALTQFALESLIKENFIPIIPPVLIKQEITRGLGYWEAGGNGDYYVVFDPVCRYCDLDLGFQAIVNEGLENKLIELLKNKFSDSQIDELRRNNAIMGPYMDQGCIRCNKSLNSSNLLYLIGTAEHSLVPMHKDELLNSSKLPLRYIGFSPAFRREAGTYGKDTKGILRVHQFDKIEMVSFVKEGDDDKENDYLLSLEEKLFQSLEIPYQVVKMCTGDLGFPAARKYDIEAWIPSQNKFREVTSVSTVTDFQARRLNIKYLDSSGSSMPGTAIPGEAMPGKEAEKKYVNILNGTAFAIGRTIIAILENYQQEDGSVAIPQVLQKYMGKDIIKT